MVAASITPAAKLKSVLLSLSSSRRSPNTGRAPSDVAPKPAIDAAIRAFVKLSAVTGMRRTDTQSYHQCRSDSSLLWSSGHVESHWVLSSRASGDEQISAFGERHQFSLNIEAQPLHSLAHCRPSEKQKGAIAGPFDQLWQVVR